MDSAAAHQHFRKTSYFEALDALRFLAISLVVWQHTPQEAASAALGDNPMAQRGFLGIDIFFMLSGFLIVTLYLRERDKNGQASLWQLFVRRALRLFPLYYALLALFAFFFLVVRPNGNLRPGFFNNLPYYLTFTSNWVELHGFISSYWTLSTQEQFYVLWPVVEKYAPRWSPALAAAALAASELVNFRLAAPAELALGLHYDRLPLLQVTYAPIFMGVLLAHLLHRPATFRAAYRVLGARIAPLLGLAAAVGVFVLPLGTLGGLPRLLFQLAVLFLLGSAVSRPNHALERVVTWRPLVRVGQLCYGIFLFHMVTAWVLDQAAERTGPLTPWLHFLLNYLAAYLLAEMSYRWFETPFLRLRDRFRTRAPQARAA